MRVAWVDEKKIRMSEEDYQMLLDRFNLKNAKRGTDGSTINKPCICKKYNEGCKKAKIGRCPLKKFENRYMQKEGCIVVMEKLVGYHPIFMTLRARNIIWDNGVDTKARVYISQIREKLLSMKKGR